MIKLTLNPETEAQPYSFDKQVVIIGRDTSHQADLSIADPHLLDVHVKIIEDGGRYVLVNAANDPFTSLNGLPFGKKTIKSSDLIQIGDQTLKFEVEDHLSPQVTSKGKPSGQETHSPTPDLEAIDIEALVREVEELESQTSQAEVEKEDHNVEASEPSGHPPSEEPSLIGPQESFGQTHFELSQTPTPVASEEPPPPPEPKDPEETKKYYLQDFDDETENWNPENTKYANQSGKQTITVNWKMFAGFLIALFSISVIFGLGFYFRASGKNSQEEKKIAAGIADMAMAMTYAQINHITPNKQHWADPDFLRNNLASVLSPSLHTQAQVNNQGQFNKYPYILRVYTSGDMSRFLVIAQPAPNVLQWLVHKKTIVIDSAAMEMRKITDLKRLNRLLAAPNPLDGNNGDAIARALKEGSLMTLTSLAGNKNLWGFTPPKALEFLRPGAENYIYNAPRYYPFGETILRNALLLSQNPGSSEDVTELLEDIAEISKFSDIVLYSSEGLQAALESQKALTTFSPHSKFLVAYVKFHSNGQLVSSHILMNEDQGEISLLEPDLSHRSSLLDDHTSSLYDTTFSFDPLPENDDAPRQEYFDSPRHPLYLRLQAVAAERPRALKPISDEIASLFNRHDYEIVPNFDETLQDLISQYEQRDVIHRERIEGDLSLLYHEYSSMPLEEFMQFIKATRLDSFVDESIATQKQELQDLTDSSETDLEKQFAIILESQTIGALENSVLQTTEILNLKELPDKESLIHYQNTMHNDVLEILGHLLLSPESIYANGPLEPLDRNRLVRILKSSWVTQPDEYEYFLSEFDHLYQNTAQNTDQETEPEA